MADKTGWQLLAIMPVEKNGHEIDEFQNFVEEATSDVRRLFRVGIFCLPSINRE